MGHHGPDRARHLVGQRHSHRIKRSSRQQSVYPGIPLFLDVDPRACAMNQPRSQVRVAAFADPQHSDFPARVRIPVFVTADSGLS